MRISTLSLLALVFAAGCGFDFGDGDVRTPTGGLGGVSVSGPDGGIFTGGSGTGGTGGNVTGGNPCFVPCEGAYGSNCGWVCGGQGP